MCQNVEKNIYKLYTKVWNINTDCPLSSIGVKLDKKQLRILRFPQHLYFAGWQI